MKEITLKLNDWEILFAYVSIEQAIRDIDQSFMKIENSSVRGQLQLSRDALSKIYTALVDASLRKEQKQ